MFKNSFYYLIVFFFAFAVIAGCGKEAPKQKTEEKKTDTVKQQTTQTKQDTTKEIKKEEKSDGNIMVIESTLGVIKLKLFPDKAPKTVEHIKGLVNKKFYDGIIFHRVIDGFMIQGGDPTGTGSSGSGSPIPDEFNNGLKHSKKGVLAMANTGRPNSQDSQFYITLAPQPSLDGKYTIFGEVISGMDVVEKIGKTKTGQGDRPVTEVKMKKVYMENE